MERYILCFDKNKKIIWEYFEASEEVALKYHKLMIESASSPEFEAQHLFLFLAEKSKCRIWNHENFSSLVHPIFNKKELKHIQLKRKKYEVYVSDEYFSQPLFLKKEKEILEEIKEMEEIIKEKQEGVK